MFPNLNFTFSILADSWKHINAEILDYFDIWDVKNGK